MSATDNAADTSSPQSQARRGFLRRSVALAGATVASATGIAAARAQKLEIPQSNLEMGRIIEPNAYGMPSKFESRVSRRRTDVLVNRQNWSDWSMTPLQDQLSIITPNGLFFERHHAGVADIDPDKHTLVIHGMRDQLVSPSGGKATVRAVPGARLLLLPDMGHDLPAPRLLEIADAIAQNAARAGSGAAVGHAEAGTASTAS